MMVNVLGIDEGALSSAEYKTNVWAPPRALNARADQGAGRAEGA